MMGWVREGSCPPERCQGRCCTHIGSWFDESPDARQFVKMLGVRGVDVKHVGRRFLVDIPQRCQYLSEAGLCQLHPSQNPVNLPRRPEICGAWPTEPAQLLNDAYCGFTFSWQDEAIPVGG